MGGITICQIDKIVQSSTNVHHPERCINNALTENYSMLNILNVVRQILMNLAVVGRRLF